MGRMVIVAFRPKPGKADELLELVREHVPTLRELGLATARAATVMRNAAGVVVEVFEWEDGAIERAHAHPDVLAMWERFAAVADYVPLGELPEAAQMFAEFDPVAL